MFTLISWIWHLLAGFFGNVVLGAALLGAAAAAAEKIIFRRKISAAVISPDARAGAAPAGSRPRRIAIVTGASGGIGAKYVRALDQCPEKYGVDEIWMIARREGKMRELADQLHLPSRVFAADLSRAEEVEPLRLALKSRREENPSFAVSVLISCAGYGKSGTSREIGRREECRMIEVNDCAAIRVTDIAVPYMRAGSRILEICSVAAFQPIPGLNAYAASKALLYSYSRGLRQELAGRGISVTAVCPYWIYDTDFIETASGHPAKPFLSVTSDHVVSRSLRSMQRRDAVSAPGLIPAADRIFAGLIPDAVLSFIAGKFLP